MFRKMKAVQLLLVSSSLAAFLLLAPGFANSAVISFDLDTLASGIAPGSATTPWLTAAIDDGGTPGSVTLTMTALNLTGGEAVSLWNFNLDPSLDPTLLAASILTKTGTFDDPSMSTAVDSFAATGDGSSDIQFAFSGGNANKKFGAGEAVSLTITSSEAILAGSFNFVSAGGIMFTAAESNGGWIGHPVPEPSSLVLIGIGAIALLAGGWRRRTRLV